MAANTSTPTGSGSLRAVLLVGTTGEKSFGQFALQELIKSKQSFRRIGVYVDLYRDNADKTHLLEQLEKKGLELVYGNGFDDPHPFEGFDCVMSFLGNHGLSLQPQLIDSAITAGVRHVYPSEYGADILVGQNWTQRYYRDKVKTRLHLEERGKDLPELGWTYVLNGRLTESSVAPHFGFDNRAARARIYGTPQGRQSLISRVDVAAYIVKTLLDTLPASTDGRRRTYRFAESSPTYATIFEMLKLITGREYEVEYLDVESAQVEEREAKEKGDVNAELAASHKLIQGREGTLLPLPWDNDRFPDITPSNLKDSMRATFSNPELRKHYDLD